MTVDYTRRMHTLKCFKFLQILFLWKGSIYKVAWFELLFFGTFYSIISIIYRFVLYGKYKDNFELFCILCERIENYIPVAFIMGFYVTMIARRWWTQFYNIPWPDGVAVLVNAYISGGDKRVKMVKRNIIRYVNISLILFLRSISPHTKKIIKDEKYLVDYNLFNDVEYELFKEVSSTFNKYFVPILWSVNLVKKMFLEGHIKTEIRARNLMIEIIQYREKLHRLFCFDWVNPPLVYTQTATISVYIYFLTSLFSKQFLDPSKLYENRHYDFYVPIFSVVQLFFYFGWLKVAEALINPFGEDDDDFDTIKLIDRNLRAYIFFIDSNVSDHPTMVKDIKWNDSLPLKIDHFQTNPNFFIGSLGETDHYL